MNLPELALNIACLLIFVSWVVCMISWVKRGSPIPLYIHFVAVVLALAGVACLVFMLLDGWFDWGWGIACLAIPGPATYLAWLWLFGPEFSRQAPKSVAPETDT